MIKIIISSLKRFITWGTQHIKQRTRPATTSIMIEALSDATHSRRDLVLENALLRQQLIVLKRQVKRPQLTQRDRLGLVLLARLTGFWQQALHIVQPDTLLTLAPRPVLRLLEAQIEAQAQKAARLARDHPDHQADSQG